MRDKDAVKLSQRHRIKPLLWRILSTIGLSDFCAIVLTLLIIAFICNLWLDTRLLGRLHWGGSVKTVAQDVCSIEQLGSKMELVLKAKCELVAHPGLVMGDLLLGSFTRVEPSDATLLEAPLFPGKVLNDFWSDRCSAVSTAADRLRLVSSQDVLILFCASFSALRVQHLLRGSHSVDAPGP